ncbi:MAG: succinate dehydrogenase, cytochrome b556 subunit [Rickettsiales bacterium]
MKRREKPLSPHLGIYRPQISSVLSIMHRLSGVYNYVGLVAVLWIMVTFQYATGNIEDSLIYIFFSTMFGQALVVAWSFSLIFHMCTGIRHLFWDLGWGFDVKTMTITGWIAVISSFAITTLCWLIAMRYIVL